MITKDTYLSELHIRACEIFSQMTKIAQHISNLLEDKRFKEIEPWGLIWDDLEAEVESLLIIKSALSQASEKKECIFKHIKKIKVMVIEVFVLEVFGDEMLVVLDCN